MSEAEDEQQDSVAALKARADALEAQLRLVEADAVRRLREAELQAEAVRAGIIDVDGLRLVDPETLSGSQIRAADVVAGLRRDKPWLFGVTNTSSTQAAPSNSPPRTRLAMDMSIEEWRAARAALLRRR